ncbi:hypothetical protein BGZ82_004296 [Podila clonocystis]|nr:hypothetical protein BGZ82_004296 [Podila clonocystis]
MSNGGPGLGCGAMPALPSLVSNAMTSTAGWTKEETENLLELEYKEEIFQYMKQMEPELTWDLRPLLVDFLIEIHNHFNLQPETLYLAMNMMDRYLSKRVVYKKHYQLVGMTSLWISSKYEDSKEKLPSVSQLCKLCSNTYDEAAFITMERHILKTLDYGLGHPTAEAFLKKDLEMSGQDDPVLKNVAQFLMELTMFQRCFLSFGSSTVAASALFLARSICRKQLVIPNDPNVFACIQYLDNSLTNVSKTVHEKYARSRLSQASILVKDWVDAGGRALIQPISTSGCTDPQWTLSNMLWQPPSPIPTTFPTQGTLGTTATGANNVPNAETSQAQQQQQGQMHREGVAGAASGGGYAYNSYGSQTQQTQPPQQQQPPSQQQYHHHQQQSQPPSQRSSQQPHQMHSGRHHSHSVSSIHSQHQAQAQVQAQAQAQPPPPPPPPQQQQQQQQPHIPYHSGQHQRTGSGLSAHVAYAALPQQPQPAVITHQTQYDIRPVGSDCGSRWVDIDM